MIVGYSQLLQQVIILIDNLSRNLKSSLIDGNRKKFVKYELVEQIFPPEHVHACLTHVKIVIGLVFRSCAFYSSYSLACIY
jgi:hypothetical protein